ncbi:MAG: cytochrome c-type biogenesis protein CcmH [Thermoflexales bacterium]|nr:cytochrome c-type biogenesis protein CcmH [Thermoflexales bacterium]MDW8351641.1 cytochrome c-type biogenesis protein CcmH [Anaerolineae bacterium]
MHQLIRESHPRSRTLCFTGLALALIVLGIGRPTAAQLPAPDEATYRIAKQLNCPTCAGRNLADCPTETCAQWKAEIKAQLDAGKSAQEVLDYFQARFGTTVLQEPPKTGVTAPLWAAPVGAALVFLVAAGVVMWRTAGRNRAVSLASAGRSEDPFVAALEDEVRRDE